MEKDIDEIRKWVLSREQERGMDLECKVALENYRPVCGW